MKITLTILIIFYCFGYYYLIDIQKWVGQFSLQQIGSALSVGAAILLLIIFSRDIVVKLREMNKAVEEIWRNLS